MELPLVVGADGSESSLQAVDWAVDEAARHGLPLRLVHASLWERYEGAGLADEPGGPPERGRAEEVVHGAAERVRRRDPHVKCSTDVWPDDAETALLRESRNATALVVGHRGRGQVAEMLLGSVGLAMATRADCPVIVVRGTAESRAGEHGRIVLGVGEATSEETRGSAGPKAEAGTASVRFAFREAGARRSVLVAVRSWRRPAHRTMDHPLLTGEPAHQHEDHAAELLDEALRVLEREHPGIEVHRTLVEGPARKVLLDLATDADLLVVGSRRQPGHVGDQLGRVPHTLLHHADCPVAVVPEWG
ncbi:universal stress protein [Streptomyces sporangiiformans]|nr:universal stress protein [Streptomyces sporangiiformans]